MRGRLLKVEPISKKFHDIFRFTRRTAEVNLGKGTKYKFVRHVLETGPAVSVLPYFYDKEKKEWFVVLVRQYRPAVDAVCLEAPGGLLHSKKNVKQEMARELFEEAGIRIDPDTIKLTSVQHLANSFCDQVLYSGIAGLKINSAKELNHLSRGHKGLASEHEFTQVVVRPISQILRNPRLVTYTLTKYQVHELASRLDYFSKKNANKKPGYVTHLG